MVSESQLTPMMAQYRRIKGELPKDALLLFRLGDFYELFFEDAQVGAQILNVALTKRGVIPMCGIPFHAANTYIGRILKAGRKVAICDQVEDARPGQLVKREVTQILSPGTHFDERSSRPEGITSSPPFTDRENLWPRGGRSDHGRFPDDRGGKRNGAPDRVAAVAPGRNDLSAEAGKLRELLGAPSRPANDPNAPSTGNSPPAAAAGNNLSTSYGWILNGYDDWVFAPETAVFTLRDHFKVASLDGFGLKDRQAAIGAAGGPCII